MSTRITLEMIYDEVKQVNNRLSLIEDFLQEFIVKGLSEVTLSKVKREKIKVLNRTNEKRQLRDSRGTQKCLNTMIPLIKTSKIMVFLHGCEKKPYRFPQAFT